METKVCATYKNGILIPEINLKNNSKVRIILEDNLYHAFSLAGEENDLEDYFISQKEILKNGNFS